MTEAEELELLELEAEEAQAAAQPAPAPEAPKSLARRGVEWLGRQAQRVPGAIRGGVQAYQQGDPYNAANKAGQGFMDPASVQPADEMMGNFGISQVQDKPQIKTPPPGAQFNFKTMDFTPAQAETTMVSPAQEAGAAFEFLAPTGLEFLPPFLKGAIGISKGLSKAAIKGAAAGVDAARGIEGGGAVDALKGAVQGLDTYRVRQAAKVDEVMNPKHVPDAPNMKRIGQGLGFDEKELSHPAIEFGQNSVQARRNKVLAQGEGGGPYLEQHNRMTDKIQGGFDRAVYAIGGRPLEPVQAGELIRNGVFSGAKRIADNVTATHGTIMDQFPGLMVDGAEVSKLNSAVNGIEKFAKGRAIRGVVPEQMNAAKSILNSVESIRNSKMSYKQLNEAREIIGDVAFQDVGSIGKLPAYQQKMRDLYFAINDALIETVGKKDRVRAGQFRAPGETFAPLKEELVKSNQILHELFQDENAIGRALGKEGKAPESIFNEALLYGDTRKVKALKNILAPQEFQQLKGSYINALVKRGKPEFTYKSARNTLANNRSVIGEMFADAPGQLQPLSEIIELGDRVGPALLPGSAGQLDFGGANSISKRLMDAVTAPIGDMTAGVGRARAGAAPSIPLEWSPYKQLPIHQSLKLMRPQPGERPNLPPYLQRGQ